LFLLRAGANGQKQENHCAEPGDEFGKHLAQICSLAEWPRFGPCIVTGGCASTRVNAWPRGKHFAADTSIIGAQHAALLQ
jgi:hypothetical protein